MKTSEITRRAEDWLSKAKVTKAPVEVASVAKVMGVTIKYGPMPDELSGFLLHENGSVVLGVNSLHPKTRQRFTIAHELGHYALHPHSNFVDHKVLYFRNPKASQGVDPQEMDANQFAADLLMPERLIKNLLRGEAIDLEDEERIQALAQEFNVSTQALTFRLLNLQQLAKQ